MKTTKLKTFTLAILSFLVFSAALAQAGTNYNVGDVFTITTTKNNLYNEIEVPRKNIIMKRGGVADYSSLRDLRVKISKIKGEGDKQITYIERADGKRFFGSHQYLKVKLDRALESKELVRE